MAKKRQLTPAEIAAQNEAMEAAEIQHAFEQGTNTLRDLISEQYPDVGDDTIDTFLDILYFFSEE